MKQKQPNILIIMTDQQRYDSLGCYGFEGAHTPNLDEKPKREYYLKIITYQIQYVHPVGVAFGQVSIFQDMAFIDSAFWYAFIYCIRNFRSFPKINYKRNIAYGIGFNSCVVFNYICT